nr:hypothetical protein [Plesiomonas shigelloides]
MHMLSTVLCILLLLPVSTLSTAKAITSTRLPGTLSDSWPRIQIAEQSAVFNWPARYVKPVMINKSQKADLSKKERNHIVSAHLSLLLR